MPNRAAIAMGCLCVTLLNGLLTLAAQNLPPCGFERPTSIDVPWAGEGDLWCVEQVLIDQSVGAIGFTQIVTMPDGSLYVTVPMLGQLVHVIDTNNDALPDISEVVLRDLTRPTGITYHEGQLYIAGNQHVYRYDPVTDELTTLVDDLPFGWTGYPTGGLTVYEERLYIGVGGDVACTPERGAIYSFALDGTDREVVATGIESPADIAVFDDALWVVDTATDRLMQVQTGKDYGACSGENPPDVLMYTFEVGSAPIALVPYDDTTFPQLAGSLLVALRGNVGEVTVQGYSVVAVELDDSGIPAGERDVLPVLPENLNVSEQKMHIQGSGFFPNHVYGVAVDSNGWVYISAGAGQIVALRPV